MESDTDCLPQLDDDPTDFVETIVLEDSDVMETRELRQLQDLDAEPSGVEEDDDEG